MKYDNMNEDDTFQYKKVPFVYVCELTTGMSPASHPHVYSYKQ